MFAARAMSRVAVPARAAVSRAAVGAPKRGMAGGAAPKYEGWEAKVREKLPKDEHVSSKKSRARLPRARWTGADDEGVGGAVDRGRVRCAL